MSGFSFVKEYIQDGTNYMTYRGKYRISIQSTNTGTYVMVYDEDFDKITLSGRRQKKVFYLSEQCVSEEKFYEELKSYFY